MHEGEVCLEACLPVEKKAFGMKMKTEQGLDRETCRTCFMNRRDSIYDGSYHYKAIGKTLYTGNKCSEYCLDKKGPIQLAHAPSLECQQCVGINGFPGEKFSYLLDGKHCFELDSTNRRRVVPMSFCKQTENVITTIYKAKRDGNFIFGYTDICEEIDEKTMGNIFRKTVSSNLCVTEAVDDSDRSIKQEVEREERNKPGTRSSKQ